MEVLFAFLIPFLIVLPFAYLVYDELRSSKNIKQKKYSNLDKIADIKEIEFIKSWNVKNKK